MAAAASIFGSEPIFLDPICRPGVSRRPALPPGKPAPSTQKMGALLKELADKADPATLGYFSEKTGILVSNAMVRASNLSQRIPLQFKLALHQMNDGRPDFALNTFAAIEDSIKADGGHLSDAMESELRSRKAMAFLRLGEQENCLAQHNAESCLFPLRPRAYHLLPRGARGAMALFSEQLEKHPDDLGARWLLNIAYMTLGDYPDKVPAKYLIPPDTFATEYEMPRFNDVSDKLGLDLEGLSGGTVVDDFDNDGFLDIVTTSFDILGQMRYFHNNGDGTFTERTSEAGLVGEVGGLNVQQTDYNNDGFLDLFVLRGGWMPSPAGRFPHSLLRNNRDGTFTDVTEEAGLLSFHPTQTCEWLDYDGDGWLDLFVGNETTNPNDPDPCELFHNNRNGTFTECAKECGLDVKKFVKGVTCADYDGDGRPDLYLSIRAEANLLFHNEGPGADGKWQFKDVTRTAGVAEPINSFSTWFFDFDNDGREDLFCAGYLIPHGVADVAADYLNQPSEATMPKLYHNNGDGTFTDVTVSAHLNRVCHTMGCNFGDIDNDGWLDFYCATGDPDLSTLIPKRMFRNAGGKYFQDVSTATGTGHLQKGHGVAFADIDNDGDQDVHIVLGGAYPGDTARHALFLNPGNANNWLKLKLIGTKANRAAIGATLTVNVINKDGSVRKISRRITHGASFGANPLRAEIGLGGTSAIRDVEIRWPGSNTRQTIQGLALNQAYEIHEDSDKPLALNLKSLDLQKLVTAHAAVGHP